MDRDLILKKNIVGGFNRKQVLAYITQLQTSCDTSRSAKAEIDELRQRISVLRELSKEKDKQIASLTTEIDKINSNDIPDEADFEILKRSSEKIDEARADADSITATVNEGIKSKEEKISALFERLASINSEISRFSGRISELSDKLDTVPFEPIIEPDADAVSAPTFDFEKVKKAYEQEQEQEEVAIMPSAPIDEVESEEAKGTEEADNIEDIFEIETLDENDTPSEDDKVNKKFDTLFEKLSSMTDEINRMQGSISDVSEKLDRVPEAVVSPAPKTEEPVVEDKSVPQIEIEEENPFDALFDDVNDAATAVSAESGLISASAEADEPKHTKKKAPSTEIKIESAPEQEVSDIDKSAELIEQKKQELAKLVEDAEKKEKEKQTEQEESTPTEEPAPTAPTAPTDDSDPDTEGEVYFTLEF